jgi:hypothetical protein
VYANFAEFPECELRLIGFLGSSAWANMELTLTKGGYGPLAQ